jgi:predicted phosphodiesterase
MKEAPSVSDRLLKERGPQNAEVLAASLGIGVDVVEAAIDGLRKQGYTFTKEGSTVMHSTSAPTGTIFDYSKKFSHNLHFGVISDTHLGSKKERLDSLETMYDTFKTEGVKHVFHTGDLTDGWGVYRGQEFEVNKFGQEEQVDYTVDKFPQRKGITTHFICGNHDTRQYEIGGIDVGVPISQRRKDMDYLGQAYARVILPEGVEMDLLHPGGQQAYALSYKAQRYINNLSPSDIPNILLFGHFHTSFYMNYRNVHFLQIPCFKDGGIFERRLGLNPTIGAWMVDAKISSEGGISQFKPQLFTF